MDIVEQRMMSGLSISLATSHALETLIPPRNKPFDPKRIIPKPIQSLSHYKHMYISILTLVRNMLGALDKPILTIPPPIRLSLINALVYEMELISNVVGEVSGGVTKPIFYINDQQQLYLNKNVVPYLRMPNTKKQRQVHRNINSIVSGLLQDPRGNHLSQVYKGTVKIRTSGAAIILSHVPYDLLGVTRFQDVALLESHTGKMKARKDWYTKLYPVPKMDMSIIPFDAKLLVLFGDKVSFKPNKISTRKEVIKVAIAHQWNYMTTMTKVRKDLKTAPLGLSEIYQGLPALPL